MPRSQAVRAEALRLDNYHCQITGFDGRGEQERRQLEVHHVIPIGGGGPDTVENCITLRTGIHTPYVEDKALTIDAWDRQAGVLEVTDHQGVLGPVGPVRDLWFHLSRVKSELEAEEELITNLVGTDREIARMCWHRWTNDNFKLLDPDAKSFRAYTEARSWPTNRFENLAELFETARSCGIPWNEGESARAYRHRLRAAGKISDERDYWHLEFVTPLAELAESGAVIVSKDRNSTFGARLPEGVKVGKLHGLKSGDGGLTDRNGRQIRMIPIPEDLTETGEIPTVRVGEGDG